MVVALTLDAIMCILSLWMLALSWREWQVVRHGNQCKARVLAVRHVIPTGWHKFHGRVDGSFDCDYVLSVQVGARRPVELILRSRMRILGGNRVLRYAPGDKVDVRYLDTYPRTVLPVEGCRGGSFGPVCLWGFCSVTTFAIGLVVVLA